ncbi:DUF1232 domain-containing protein [Frankia sp. Hr75.2]|uniref:YkvA family protein n=1 Tax=Parafrankia soli TaxID=2599596 RepID=UPI0028A4E60A|nr:DUF1232 domain-containing protein [Frankia sp. Hr75.2]
MSDGVGTGLVVVLGVIAAVGLVLVAGTFYLLRRYRLPLHGVAATIASLLYVISPVDAVPEIPLGPVGLVDDLAVILGALFYVRKLVDARRPGPAELEVPGRGRGRGRH